jgi:hypothetical protein
LSATARWLAQPKATQHRLQRTAASPLAGMRREPAKVLVGKGVLPVPPLPLKPTVMPPISARLVSVPRNPSMNLESQRMEDKTFTYLLEAYKIAISYFSDYANRVWTRFNILLAIDVGLATLLWNTWQGNQQQNMSILLPFLGLVVSLLLYVQSAQDKYAIRHQMRRINQIRVILEEKTGQKDIPALFTPLDDTDLQKREFLFEGITSWRSNFISVTRIPAITSLLFMLFWIGMIIITLSK